MASQPKRRITQPIGVNTPKNMIAIIAGLTTACSSSANFIHARLSGVSHSSLVSVIAAKIAASAMVQGCAKADSVNTPANSQPKLRLDGRDAVFIAMENSLTSALRRRGPALQPDYSRGRPAAGGAA